MHTNCVYAYIKYDIFTDSYSSSISDYILRRRFEVIMCVHVFRAFRNKKRLLGMPCTPAAALNVCEVMHKAGRERERWGGAGGVDIGLIHNQAADAANDGRRVSGSLGCLSRAAAD